MHATAPNLSNETQRVLCSSVPYGRSSTCVSCMHKSLGDVLLAVGDPAVEMDLLLRAEQVSYGPKPGENCKQKKQVTMSMFLPQFHIDCRIAHH